MQDKPTTTSDRPQFIYAVAPFLNANKQAVVDALKKLGKSGQKKLMDSSEGTGFPKGHHWEQLSVNTLLGDDQPAAALICAMSADTETVDIEKLSQQFKGEWRKTFEGTAAADLDFKIGAVDGENKVILSLFLEQFCESAEKRTVKKIITMLGESGAPMQAMLPLVMVAALGFRHDCNDDD